MTTYRDQVERQLALAQATASQVTDPWDANALLDAVSGVWDAWQSRDGVASADDCQTWATGSSSWQRVQFGVWCDGWADRLSRALERLGDALVDAGDPGAAEAADSLAVQAREAANRDQEIVGDPVAEVPGWAWALLALVGWRLLGGSL